MKQFENDDGENGEMVRQMTRKAFDRCLRQGGGRKGLVVLQFHFSWEF
jgi:hypothetical protein